MKIVNDTFNCGVRTVVAQPEGVCSQMIELKLFGDEIMDVTFYGGCSGNLKGIAALAKGHKVSDVEKRLSGITESRRRRGLISTATLFVKPCLKEDLSRRPCAEMQHFSALNQKLLLIFVRILLRKRRIHTSGISEYIMKKPYNGSKK